MRKIFILGGSSLQLDLILEAKKMFFYTIVLDLNKDCIGSKWCDEFLNIDIADKESILKKAIEYNIDSILTSATEVGNISACWVGEKLKLNTNTYQTSLNTTKKNLMKDILTKNNILTAKFELIHENDSINWDIFPAIVKPLDSASGKGLSYIKSKSELGAAIKKAKLFSNSEKILIEEYIKGKQFSVETISCNNIHQIIAIDYEKIHSVPNIIEMSHTIPAKLSDSLNDEIKILALNILDIFNIQYGACHIELKITPDNKIFIIELASRTGGMRTEMINLSCGISYSQLLLLSSLNSLSTIEPSKSIQIKCNFIINHCSYTEYLKFKDDSQVVLFEPIKINNVDIDFIASNLAESAGYYFILENK